MSMIEELNMILSRDAMIMTGKLTFLEKSMSQCPFVQHKSQRLAWD